MAEAAKKKFYRQGKTGQPMPDKSVKGLKSTQKKGATEKPAEAKKGATEKPAEAKKGATEKPAEAKKGATEKPAEE